MKACEMGNINSIYVLLDAGVDPKIVNVHGDTCLHYAANEDCSKAVVLSIISHGADVNATNKCNQTSLLSACAKGNIDAIIALVNAGADPNIPDADGDTCLHNAVGKSCSKYVPQTIISHGADVNATNKNNVTSLMLACEKGNKYTINLLLNAGADPNIADV